MLPNKHVVAELAKQKEQVAIEEYTDTALQKTDLSTAKKLQLVSKNQSNRLSIIKRIQKHTLDNVFLKNPDCFFTKDYHYDWWVFPMHVPKEWEWEQRNYDASLTLAEAQTLLHDPDFVDTYSTCITLYLDALEKHGWNDYPVRYARLLHSIALFMEGINTTEGMNKTHEKLYNLGKRVIDYAQINIIENYAEYGLLNIGFKAAQNQLEKSLALSANINFKKV
jgi:hypothetical protein